MSSKNAVVFGTRSRGQKGCNATWRYIVFGRTFSDHIGFVFWDRFRGFFLNFRLLGLEVMFMVIQFVCMWLGKWGKRKILMAFASFNGFLFSEFCAQGADLSALLVHKHWDKD